LALSAQAVERHLARRLQSAQATSQAEPGKDNGQQGSGHQAGVDVHDRHYSMSILW